MATSTLTDIVKDPGGNVVATSSGTVVNFRLMAKGCPTPGFRVSDGVNVASLIVTAASTAGSISQALENNSNIVPTGTYYVAEILCPTSQGGTQEWALLSSSSVSPQKFHDALAAVIPSFTPITTVPGSVLTGNNTFTGTNQFSGNVFFKSGLPWVDVRAYGATGDGVTDDSAAFISAQANGLNIYVPAGTYAVKNEVACATAHQTWEIAAGATIDITGSVAAGHANIQDAVNSSAAFYITADDVTIRGDGRITGAKTSGAVSLNGVIVNGPARTTVAGLEIDSMYSGVTQGGGCSEQTLAHLRLHDHSHNVKVGFDSGATLQVKKATYLDLDSWNSGVVSQQGDGIKFNSNVTDITVLGGKYHDNGSAGIDCYVGGSNITFVGVLCNDNGDQGFDLKYAADTGTFGTNRRCTIIGCRARSNGVITPASGFSVRVSSVVTYPNGVEGIQFIGCYSESNTAYGYILGLGRGSVVSDCWANANTLNGFHFEPCYGVPIHDNSAIANTVDGFYFHTGVGGTETSEQVDFHDNMAHDNGAYGYVIEAVNDSKIHDNNGTNNTTADWNVVAGTTNNVFFANLGSGRTNTIAANVQLQPSGAVASNAQNGFTYLPTMSGTPSGTPTTLTGQVPLVIDTSTNNVVRLYMNGIWRSIFTTTS